MARLRLFAAMVVILTLAWGIAAAQQTNTISGKHLEQDLSCADCHNTDTPEKRPPVSSCYGCHGEYPDVAELTADMEMNPHNSHQGEIRCTLCHTSHKPPVLYCNECHSYEMIVP